MCEGSDDKPKPAGLAKIAEMLCESPWSDVLAYNERTTELMFMRAPPCLTAHKNFPVALVDPDFTSVVQWFRNDKNQRHQNEVARCLQHLGWRRVQKRLPPDQKRSWVYVPPLSPVSPTDERESGDGNPSHVAACTTVTSRARIEKTVEVVQVKIALYANSGQEW